MQTLDIYSAYAYQQQLQHQLLNTVGPQHLLSSTTNCSNQSPTSAEVLDLSRRNSLDIPNKTNSPYTTGSSFSSESPSVSPNSLITAQQQTVSALLPANLLYAAQVQPSNNLNIPANLAALYPGLYYPSNSVKPEPMSTTPPPVNVATNPSPVVNNNNLLQTVASVAAVTSMKPQTPEPQSPQQPAQSNIAAATTPTSSSSCLTAFDSKNTRPFKAFPRDPLVIAANFAATDVLLDNPRVERYTEYRKRVLEQIRSSNGGSHTVTNPKMRRTNSCSGKIQEGSSSNTSENDERHHEESSDCESNSGHDNQTTTTTTTLSNSTKSEQGVSNNNSSSSNGGGLVKDAAYYERRRKNNAAAKKSRDRRRIKEDEIAIRAAYLERQNIELLCQIDALKAQLAALTSRK